MKAASTCQKSLGEHIWKVAPKTQMPLIPYENCKKVYESR